jgi:6-phosphogluconolactonase
MGLRSAVIDRSFVPCACISASEQPGEACAGITDEAEECVVTTIAYVSNAESKDIFAFDMDPQSGALNLIERVPVPGTDLPSPTSLPMAVSPDRRFLYAALRSPPFAASSFAIDPSSGRLSHLATTPLLCPMAYIVIDRSGRSLLAASYTDARLAIYPIDSAGQIESLPTQVIPTGPNAHCIVIDAANRFAYSAVLGADHVMQFVFDSATATLVPNTPPTVATRARSGPRHLALHPSGRFNFLLNQTDATIVSYRIEPGAGGLSEIETVATLPAHFLGEANAADIHVTPDGRFLFASERQTSTLTGFRIDAANGFLTPIGHWNTETTPRGFAIDPRGRFLLAAGLDSNRLSVHAIDPEDGRLEPQAQYPVGGMPNWVEIVDLP